jgi:peptidoglycan-associated lipoprotein
MFMQIKKIIQLLIVSGSFLALSACSTTKKPGDQVAVNDANGVQASGLGQGDSYGDSDNLNTSQQAGAKRTYYFDFDKSDVRDEDRPAIEANADNLTANPGKKVIVEGHTDPRGSREYNVALGEHRANAVANILKSKGANPNQIRVVSYGAERLASPGHTEEDYQQDRRAVIASNAQN